MPRLSQAPSVTTTTEIDLSTSLKTKARQLVEQFAKFRADKKKAENQETIKKTELETLFIDEGFYDELRSGVRIETTLGSIPVKLCGGERKGPAPKGKINEARLMKKFNLTPKQLDSVRDDPPPPKAEYILISLPEEEQA